MSRQRKLLRLVTARLDLLLLVVFVLALDFLPKKGGLGVPGSGMVSGARLGLQALGIILVLRSNRIINFAQLQLGALSATIFYLLWTHNEFILGLRTICPQCFPGITDEVASNDTANFFYMALRLHHYDTLLALNFWLSVVVGLALAPLVGYLVYVLIIRRFEAAPRLIVTVATIAISQTLASVVSVVPGLIFRNAGQAVANPPLPIPAVDIYVAPTHFFIGDLLTVGVAAVALAALAIFFLRSKLGVAMRGAAENPGRAETLGISVTQVSSVAWMLAGVLAGLGAMLDVLQGSAGGSTGGVDVTTMVKILAAVIFARLVSLPLAVVASLLLGVAAQVLYLNSGSEVPFDGLLVLLIGAALLLQRNRQSRAEIESGASYLASREARPIPPELRAHVAHYVHWFWIVIAAVVLTYPFLMEPTQVSGGATIMIYGMLGLSLLILTGWAGQISLGQFSFAAVGGYVASVVGGRFGVPMPLALLVGAIAASAVAVVVGLPALRLRGLHLAVTTMAFAVAVTTVLLNPDYLGKYLPSELGRPRLVGFDTGDEKVFYFMTLAFLGLVIGVVVGLRRGRTARALIGCRDNEQAAQSFGINIFLARLEAFALSGFLAGLGGALLAYEQHGMSATSYAPAQSVNIFLMVIIGGLSSIAGPILGAVYVGLLLLFNNPLVAFLLTGAGVLGVLLLVPGGLGGLAYAIRDSILRRVAVRQRIVVPSLLADTRGDAGDGRAVMVPERRPGGGTAFVPVRYRVADQWTKFEGEK